MRVWFDLKQNNSHVCGKASKFYVSFALLINSADMAWWCPQEKMLAEAQMMKCEGEKKTRRPWNRKWKSLLWGWKCVTVRVKARIFRSMEDYHLGLGKSQMKQVFGNLLSVKEVQTWIYENEKQKNRLNDCEPILFLRTHSFFLVSKMHRITCYWYSIQFIFQKYKTNRRDINKFHVSNDIGFLKSENVVKKWRKSFAFKMCKAVNSNNRCAICAYQYVAQ